jgi:hypothetical protein
VNHPDMRVDENKDLGNEDTTKGNKCVWYLRRGKILYKDNLAKCSWQENKKVCILSSR